MPPSVDLVRLEDGGVVFPEDEHGVRVVGELRQHGQRDAFLVDGARGGSGGIDADANHAFFLNALHDALDDDFEAFEVVQRVLAELVVRSVAIFALAPAGIVLDAGGEDLAVFHVDQHGSYAVGTEIKSDRQLTAHGFLLLGCLMYGERLCWVALQNGRRPNGRTGHGGVGRGTGFRGLRRDGIQLVRLESGGMVSVPRFIFLRRDFAQRRGKPAVRCDARTARVQGQH